ncbi:MULTISPECIES: helix-turn-helix domain-containing protein [Paenibacillus]|uniref:HTH cro/C1-type domain-containing protein n=2 Tax=Paenibacillus TaxID=44249 RepID=A0ABQ1VZD1_9BACL|nr:MULTISPECIES: helix-turn-helix transcriptional regulator [Paenibacillus]UQZ84532.1 helix-turn-helix protein [Paenibacillus konkukensis]GGG07045.1 hypothetical protein GCM10010913_31080 [Paenibacillus aceti]
MASRPITTFEFLKLKESTLGERIRFFREEVGKLNAKSDYTTKAISERLGVTPQSITAVERGDSKNPSYQLVYGLTKELNISLDVLNDDFYRGEIKTFTIGCSELKPASQQSSSAERQSDLPSDFHFGCYIYQLFPNGRMRFIYNKDTVNTVDHKTFIDCLARFIAEVEMHSRSGDLFDDAIADHPSPLHHAIELFKASIEHPNVFPLFPIKDWNQLYNDFLSKYEQQEDKQDEQA